MIVLVGLLAVYILVALSGLFLALFCSDNVDKDAAARCFFTMAAVVLLPLPFPAIGFVLVLIRRYWLGLSIAILPALVLVGGLLYWLIRT
jgi:hypothetical protein